MRKHLRRQLLIVLVFYLKAGATGSLSRRDLLLMLLLAQAFPFRKPHFELLLLRFLVKLQALLLKTLLLKLFLQAHSLCLTSLPFGFVHVFDYAPVEYNFDFRLLFVSGLG